MRWYNCSSVVHVVVAVNNFQCSSTNSPLPYRPAALLRYNSFVCSNEAQLLLMLDENCLKGHCKLLKLLYRLYINKVYITMYMYFEGMDSVEGHLQIVL